MRVTTGDLDYLEHLRLTLQRHRIQMGNRIAAVESGRSQGNIETPVYFAGQFQRMEDEVAAMIKEAIKEHPMWPWLECVRGIGPGLAGSLVGPIDIHRAYTTASLWRYAGQGIADDNRRDRPVPGQKLPYNAQLKRTMYLVEASFMRSGSPYRRIYDEAKAYYTAKRPEWTKAHVDMAAKRKMGKIFLSHLWTIWRDLEGLPMRRLYVVESLGHDGILTPWEFTPEYEYTRSLREYYADMSYLARRELEAVNGHL